MKNDKNFSEEETAGSELTKDREHAQGGPLESMTLASTDTKAAAIEELRRHLKIPVLPVPDEALRILQEAACQDTGGSQACRSFLFWLVGQIDPTGYQGSGGFELRRMDGQLKDAAIQVLRWWSGPTKSDEPLYGVLASLRLHFEQNGGNRDQLRLPLKS